MAECTPGAGRGRDAAQAWDELGAAPKGAGVALPSPERGRVLVVGGLSRSVGDLGRWTSRAARRLAPVVGKCAP
ncbi:hypothetical protein Stube_34220 [Streptomyces tubercidicus]|uniref:Uncharacterized protein n=1 Tax=Streptomyces tubercidicus TaxID=47759 RepID=A0A640USJ0_9ACTN|nr:hypothetical protein Stube_34220 [Streptomyces tubercidicus]